MKEILLINNENDVKEYLISKVSYKKIITLTYEAAILCDQKNIKFIYIKDIYRKKDGKISELFYRSYQAAKKIDKKITQDNNLLKNYSFFTNYFNFTKGNLFIQIYDEYITFLIKKFPTCKINYYDHNNCDYFDFFTECIKSQRNKNNFFGIKPIYSNYKNNYFNSSDDGHIPTIKKIIIKLLNLNFFNQKSLLFYLVHTQYVKILKKYGIIKKTNIIQYTEKITNIDFVQEMNLKYPFITELKKKKPKAIFFQKYLNYLFPYIVNQVLNTHRNIDKIYKKKKIYGFVTQHDTLISNTIKQYLNSKNIKTLTLLHGGTLSHFKDAFFWPTLANSNLETNNISHFQNYSDFHKKISSIQNLKFKTVNNKNTIHSFHSEEFLDLKNTYDHYSKKKIAYVVQSSNNVLSGKLQGGNDSYKLYLARNSFFKKIFSLKDFKIHVSHTGKKVNFLADKATIELGLKNKKMLISKFNAIEILKKTNIAVFEQPSTTLIEALFLNVPLIIILKNPLFKLNNYQEIILKKRVYFVDNLSQAIEIIKEDCKIKTNSTFMKTFYPIKKGKNFYAVLNELFR